jgi:C-terminal processing protease CtpA/Prc
MTPPRLLPILVLAFAFGLASSGVHADTGTPGESTHRMAGIGIAVANDVAGPTIHRYISVRRVAEGSPAMEQGIKSGDKIIAVDDVKVAGKNIVEVIEKRIRGELASPVKLRIEHTGDATPVDIVLVRTIVPSNF